MSDSIRNNHGYSANIQMHLSVNGHVFSIGQLGPNFLLLDNPIDHPAGEGVITLHIDGREKSWPVYLPDGITAGKAETRVAL